MTDEQIKYMVDRFLGWRLPDHFQPDAGISFNPEYNVEYNARRGAPPARHEPTGTNLFDATQAEAMVRYMVDGMTLVRPDNHEAAKARIAECVREIEIICDEFGYDQTEWLITPDETSPDLPSSAQGQRQMTQGERDAMNRALDKSVTVVDHGYSSTVGDGS